MPRDLSQFSVSVHEQLGCAWQQICFQGRGSELCFGAGGRAVTVSLLPSLEIRQGAATSKVGAAAGRCRTAVVSIRLLPATRGDVLGVGAISPLLCGAGGWRGS